MVDEKDSFLNLVETMFPKNLDDIIRQNRQVVELYLTSDEEVFELYWQITPNIVKDVINNWSLISLRINDIQLVQVMLLGNVGKTTTNRLTSNVVRIDLDRQLLITKSGSLYQLGTKHKGELDQDQLITVCAVFHSWGFGDYLGVPRFFF
jgi:hypothetical protein